ncbi:hypothetical protein ACFXPI_05530 [Streptomyces sp. NPDC059104]|uniref:hypothetical protein n=1 Tax=Streptomyces sp. NPDC059104 TaxID=3346729 RepID=UPI00367CD308
MFIRPVGVTVSPAARPPGHPLLRGLLRRAAGAAEWATAEGAEEGGAGEGAGENGLGENGLRESDLGEESVAEELEAALEEGVRGEAGADREPEGPGAPEGGGRAEPPTEAEPPHPPPAVGPTLVAELTQLSDLARQGLLTPEEFTLAKGRLLRG